MLFTIPGLGGLLAGMWLIILIPVIIFYVVAILIAVWV